jgi:hypothetical protein
MLFWKKVQFLLNGCIFGLYSGLKSIKMRSLFLVFMMLSSVCLGQNNIPEQNNSGSKNSVSPGAAEEMFDTLVPEMRMQEVQEAVPSSKRSKNVSRSESPVLQDKFESNSAISVNSAAQSFSVVRTSAAQNRIQRSPSPEYQRQMDQAVNQLEQMAPESFEYHFFSYQAGNYNIDLIDHLNKAELLKPGNSDVQIQKAAYHFIQGEQLKALNYLDKLVASKRIGQDVLDYGKDLLLSTAENGVLITHGMDDTFGALYHQLKNGVRNDATVLSLDLMQSDQYRDRLKNKGYRLPEREVIDVTYLSLFCQLNASKDLSVSLTFPKEYLVTMSEKLFVTGLVFLYSSDPNHNNFDRNDRLWNDILEKKAAGDVYTDKGRQLSSNYLPMLLLLSEVYGELNESTKKKDIDKEIDRISVQCNKYEQVRQIKSAY